MNASDDDQDLQPSDLQEFNSIFDDAFFSLQNGDDDNDDINNNNNNNAKQNQSLATPIKVKKSILDASSSSSDNDNGIDIGFDEDDIFALANNQSLETPVKVKKSLLDLSSDDSDAQQRQNSQNDSESDIDGLNDNSFWMILMKLNQQ